MKGMGKEKSRTAHISRKPTIPSPEGVGSWQGQQGDPLTRKIEKQNSKNPRKLKNLGKEEGIDLMAKKR